MTSHAHLSWFQAMLNNPRLVRQLKEVTLVITDVDGSLTDGTVHYDANGEADRMYSPQDGFGLRMAMDNGIKVAFLSGNAGSSIISRARKLRIPEALIILGAHDKRVAVKSLQTVAGASSHQTLIFGDDYLDAAVKEYDPGVVFAMPANGIFYLHSLADCVLPSAAGAGSALRLMLDLILYAQGKHFAQHLIRKALETSHEKKLTPSPLIDGE